MTILVVRNVEIDGVGGADVLIRDGAVAAVAPETPVPSSAEVVDGDGGALLPGLHDHHIHLHALAADRASVRCGPPAVRTADDLARALGTAPGEGWVRGVGYSEDVAGLLDSVSLDALHADRPVRIQHRSGAVWFLNSPAAVLTGLATADHPGVERDEKGHPTGRVWRADTWLRDRLPDSAPPSLADVGAELASYGITGLTDATPDLTPSTLEHLRASHVDGSVPQRIRLLGAPLDFAGSGTFAAGPYKIVLADSGLPDLDHLATTIRRAHDAGRGVAVHCVSREAFAILLAVLTEVGTVPGDRIEHGALVPPESIDDLRRLGLQVVTQPGFLADRGDAYVRDVPTVDQPDLYRCRSLLDGGVPVALSSDAPYGPADPWTVMSAAVTRTCPTGDVVGADERIPAATALARYLAPLDNPGGAARRVRVGAPADLVLLDRPLAGALAAPTADAVRATVIGGRVVHHT
ncbi:amidohydrolase family protein [Rhodococcus pyridinivorans]|uniref:Amidohydrolase family protein n=1 Tax=Rhodococcus pyridinivorans TaxID=103816 RepID=A0A7M2XKH0_9NOCA|nr:amidohydrolase family protein [Rhodococcus pyridinivorans]QOV98258.1 amidohydrolase family protein [Rhodococcus pyridinivorans]WMM72148.1 amidohydrolase family protein [Rhodococcus pyridinivorans]